MRRLTATISLVTLLGACGESDAARCKRVSLEATIAEASRTKQRSDAELRAAAVARNPTDSTYWGPAPKHDSLLSPPPRPSDVEWSAEHCFEGTPR